MNQIIISDQYATLKDELYKVSKRILKENLSKNPITLKNYETDILQAYNNVVLHII